MTYDEYQALDETGKAAAAIAELRAVAVGSGYKPLSRNDETDANIDFAALVSDGHWLAACGALDSELYHGNWAPWTTNSLKHRYLSAVTHGRVPLGHFLERRIMHDLWRYPHSEGGEGARGQEHFWSQAIRKTAPNLCLLVELRGSGRSGPVVRVVGYKDDEESSVRSEAETKI